MLTAWVLTVIPALIAQLTFLAVQVPGLLRTAWNMMLQLVLRATDGSTDPLGVLAICMQFLFLLLPVAGLALILGLMARGVIRLVRRRKAAEETAQASERN